MSSPRAAGRSIAHYLMQPSRPANRIPDRIADLHVYRSRAAVTRMSTPTPPPRPASVRPSSAHEGWSIMDGLSLHCMDPRLPLVFLSLTVDASKPLVSMFQRQQALPYLSLTPPPRAGRRYHVPIFVYALFRPWLSVPSPVAWSPGSDNDQPSRRQVL